MGPRACSRVLATSLAVAACAPYTERAPDAAMPDAATPDAAMPDAATPDAAAADDACTPAPPSGCGPDEGTIDLVELGYERAWIVTWAGFTNGLALALADADGLGCGARAHVGGASFREDETWIGTHYFILSADESALVDPIAVTLRIDADLPRDDAGAGVMRGTLELLPEEGAPIVRTDVTIPVCRTDPSF